jgi:hypothetical protein
MLRNTSLLAFLVVFGFALSSFAAQGGGNIRRGGIGFLFPDHNNFSNAGQFSTGRAIGVEGIYTRNTASPSSQSLGTSVVYGNGRIGLGAFASRAGTSLTSGATDAAGAGLGVNLLKGRLTVGAGYTKPLSGPANNGAVTGTLTLNPPNQKGVSLGVSFARDLTSNVNSVGGALGYSFSPMAQLEVDFQLPNISTTSNFNLQAYLNLTRGMVYFSGGYTLVKTVTSLSGVAGRVGFVLGRSIDLSAIATYTFLTGSPITYGGSFRASF